MAALVADRNTPMKSTDLIAFPVKAGVKIFSGAIVVADVTGYAKPGSADPRLIYLGRAEEQVDNTLGANGAVSVLVRRNAAFKFENSAADPVTVASIGKDCYIADDQTVSATNGAGASQSSAGLVVALEADGVWVGGHVYEPVLAAATLNFPAIAAGASADLTIPLSGALVNDPVVLSLPAAVPVGLVFNAFVSAVNVVTVRATNITAAAIDAAAGTYSVAAIG